jgi:hypothetical protein
MGRSTEDGAARVWYGTVLCALAIAAAPATATGAAILSGRAGLDGRARAGRWMPVEVSIETADAVDGTVSVEWGGARVERPVSVPAGTRRTLTFTLRTGDPRSAVHARLNTSDHASPVNVSVPVVVDSSDTHVVLCVNGAADPACTSSLPRGRMPRAWQDYDVADDVRVGTEDPLTGEQRDALSLWAGRRQAEMRFGLPMDPAYFVSRPPSRRTLPWLALALVPPLAGGLAGARRRRGRAVMYAIALSAAAAGAVAAGRLPPQLGVRHVTTVHAFAGTGATIVESRFAVEARTDGTIQLTLPVAGGALDRPGPTHVPGHLTEEGFPTVALAGRLGAVYPFEAEFPGPPSPVHVERTGGSVSVENRSSQTLSDCVMPPGFDVPSPRSLAPGVRWTGTGLSPDDVMTCTSGDTVPLLAHSSALTSDGPTALVVHLGTVLP